MKIDGKAIAQHIFADLQHRVSKLKAKGVTPHLVIILVGNDPASEAYVKQKVQKGEAIGAKVSVKYFPGSVSQPKLLTSLRSLNEDLSIHGIIVQRPLPTQIDEAVIDSAVDPEKDVDGFHPETPFAMPLAAAVLKMLEDVFTRSHPFPGETFTQWLQSQNIVVLGKGKTGGGPIIHKLRTINIEPRIIDSKTHDPKAITKTADIIISTVGKSNIVTADMLKKGLPAGRQDVILVGVGMHREDDGKLHGDYDEDKIKDVTTFYSPIPGGVGPVNVAMLLENLITAAEAFAD